MSSRELHLLVVSQADTTWDALRRGRGAVGAGAVIVEAHSGDEAFAAMAAQPVDGVLVDDSSIGSGLELVRALRAHAPMVPIVVVLGADDPDAEQRLVDAGATDWLTRAEMSSAQLSRRLRHVLRAARAEAESAAALATARDATRARDEILGIVAHDLRGPLHSIRLACTELADGLSPELVARYVGSIRRAAKTGDDLIGELLDIVKIDNHGLRLEPRLVDVGALVQRVCTDHELIANNAVTRLDASLPAEAIRVHLDPDWMGRALANLIGNALVYARGTAISVDVSAGPDSVTIAVVDDGRGIPVDELPHVFDRFWQGRVRRGGAGLGLAIAKGIVQAHHGTITADNVAGRGARFRVTLPRGN